MLYYIIDELSLKMKKKLALLLALEEKYNKLSLQKCCLRLKESKGSRKKVNKEDIISKRSIISGTFYFDVMLVFLHLIRI
jgi:hypothetical protein